MSSHPPPPWVTPRPPTVGPLLRGLLALGVLFVAAYALTRSNANAGAFLFLAVVCLGLAIVALFARSVQRFGAGLLRQSGRSERDLLGGGLLLIALLTPWTIAVPTLHWSETFGGQSPLALLAIVAMLVVYVRPWRRFALPAVIVSGLALVAWLAWMTVLVMTPPFSTSGFPFLPTDLLGDGWYIGLLALAVTVDGMAARASEDERPCRPSDVWPFAIVPGMGLLRLHYGGRARFFLALAAIAVFLLQSTAVVPSEFLYWATLGSLPPPRARWTTLIPLAFGLVIWLWSLLDTRRRLVWETVDETPEERVRFQRPHVL